MSKKRIVLESAMRGGVDWESHYRNYVNDLYNYGLALGAPANICEDAIHDVFCRLHERGDISDIRNIKYFLLSSLKNRLIDLFRVEKHIWTEDIEHYTFRMDISVVDLIEDVEERELIISKLERLLNSISSHQREIIYLRYMHELSYDEIGEMLSITAETARKMVYRGIKKMRSISPQDTVLLLTVILTQIR